MDQSTRAPGWQHPLVLVFVASLVVYVGVSIPILPRFERGDLLDYYVPLADFVGRNLARGELPFWNPSNGCGFDLIGGAQAGLFYPPTWLNALLPVQAAMSVLVFVHVAWMILGFQRWLVVLGISCVPAAAGGAVVAFGLIAEAWWPPMFYTLSWTPWVLWSLERCGRCRGHWNLLLLSLFVGLQALAGFPQYFVYSMLLAGAYTLVRAVIRRTVRPLALLAAGAICGAGIASCQLVVTARYMQECYRSSGPLVPEAVHYYDDDGYTSDPATRTRITAKHLVRTAYNIVDNERPDNPRSLSSRSEIGYLGFLVPVAALLAVARCRRWEVWFFVAAEVAAAFLSLGYLGGPLPVYKWLANSLPMFGAFRSPDRILCWAVVAAGVTTAFGLDWLNRCAGPSRRLVQGLLGAGLLMLAVRWAAALLQDRETSWWPLLIWSVLVVTAMLVMGFGLSPQTVAGGTTAGRTTTALVLLLLLDLILSGRYVARWHEFPGAFYSSIHDSHSEERVLLSKEELGEMARSTGTDRIYVADAYRPIMPGSALPRFSTLPFYEPMMPQRHFDLNAALTRPGETNPPFTAFVYWNIKPEPHHRWFDWCSIRQLITFTNLGEESASGWALRGKTATGARIYENLRAMPRAALFEVPRFGTQAEALAELLNPSPLGATEGPLIEGQLSPEWKQASAETNSAGQVTKGQVAWRTDQPRRVALSVEAIRPVMLVLSDSWAPGWTCELNGTRVPILRANFLHRAVEIPAGRHVVDFRYEPPGLRLGIGLSLGTLVLLLGLAGGAEIRLRRRAALQTSSP